MYHLLFYHISGKVAGADKRTAKEVGSAFDATLSHHQSTAYHHQQPLISPLGDLQEPSTKHLLVSLITTLNASFTDYDFRSEQKYFEARQQSHKSPLQLSSCSLTLILFDLFFFSVFVISNLRPEEFEREAAPQVAVSSIDVSSTQFDLDTLAQSKESTHILMNLSFDLYLSFRFSSLSF